MNTHEPTTFEQVVVFMGDWKQLLPVVRGGRGETQTMHRCKWWPHVRRIRFTRNFRSSDPDYASALEDIGIGRSEEVVIPQSATTCTQEDFIERVFAG
jgi:hypothetical protein